MKKEWVNLDVDNYQIISQIILVLGITINNCPQHTGETMEDKTIDKIAILAKLSAISDMQLKLQQDRNQLEEELREIEADEGKSNHN